MSIARGFFAICQAFPTNRVMKLLLPVAHFRIETLKAIKGRVFAMGYFITTIED